MDDLGRGGDEGSTTTGNAGARSVVSEIFLAPETKLIARYLTILTCYLPTPGLLAASLWRGTTPPIPPPPPTRLCKTLCEVESKNILAGCLSNKQFVRSMSAIFLLIIKIHYKHIVVKN